MGMAAFDNSDFQAPRAEINTTPLVDVMLVLMVIFLVTAPMLTNAVKLELPNEAAAQVKDEKAATVSIKADGQYYWNDQLVSETELEQNLNAAHAKNEKQAVNIRADTNTNYGKVSHVLASASRIGLTNIGFITEPK